MDGGGKVEFDSLDQPGTKPERATYQKPAIAWEEPFQQTVAASAGCAMVTGGDEQCGTNPSV
jgi:hypothetical protein